MSYIGNQLSSAPFVTDNFTGDGSTTSFELSVAPASPTSILVLVNGSKQIASGVNAQYTVTGTTLVFTLPPSNLAKIEVLQLGLKNIVNVPADSTITANQLSGPLRQIGTDNFTANGTGQTFNLSIIPASANSIIVSSNGIIQNDFTLTNNILTFGFAPPAGANIRVASMSLVTNVANVVATTILDGSITGNKIPDNAIRGNNIVAGQITGNLIADNAIRGNNIVAGQITGNLIADNAIRGNNIVAGQITGNLLASSLSSNVTIDTGYAFNGNAVSTLIRTNSFLLSNVTLEAAPSNGYIQLSNNSIYGTADTTQGRGYIPVTHYRYLEANAATLITTAALPFMGNSKGVMLTANSTYEIEWNTFFLKTTAGTVTFQLRFGANPQLVNAQYLGGRLDNSGTAGLVVANTGGTTVGTADPVPLPATISIGNGTINGFQIKALVITNSSTSGNCYLQAACSAGSITPRIGSYMKVTRLPRDETGTFA